MNNENTLFYSKYCIHCKNFILQLKTQDLLSYFTKKICIDNPEIKNKLPPFLKEVPTIITDDYDQPMSSDMAFKWISFKKKNSQNNNQNNNQQEKKIENYHVDNGIGVDINNAYSGLGNLEGAKKGSTGSIDYDSFSLIKDISIQEAKGSTGSIDYDSFSLSGGQTIVQNNESNDDFDKRLEKMQKSRSLDNEFFGDSKMIKQ